MSNVLIVNDSNITQSADRLTWSTGINTVVFLEPFANTSYTFQPDAPANVIITEVPGSRTTAGVQISLDLGTTEGRYIAIGLSNEFRSSASLDLGIGLIQRGSKPLLAGRNTIVFAQPFGDTSYTFNPIGNTVAINIDMTTKTVASIDVIVDFDEPDFQFEAIGNQ